MAFHVSLISWLRQVYGSFCSSLNVSYFSNIAVSLANIFIGGLSQCLRLCYVLIPTLMAQVICFIGAPFFLFFVFDTTLVTYFLSGYFNLCQKWALS